jgi:single-strand DNA-binding protein
MNINKILLTGNLVTDPELKQINGGKSVVNVSAESGDRQKNTTFVELQIWRKPAEALSRLAKKGQEIYVEGLLRQEKWQDKQGGHHSKHFIRVDTWQFTQYCSE